MSFVDPSQITARAWLIIGLCLVVGIALFHEFVVKPARVVDQLCNRAHILEVETIAADVRIALEEMNKICDERRPID
jgi:putative copper export protein